MISVATALLLGLLPLAGEPLVVCDFDQVTVPWASKFSRHEVVETSRDGQPTRALRLPIDLSVAPSYDWVRALVSPRLDLSGSGYLNLTFRVEGKPMAAAIPMLIQRDPTGSSHGERVASANQYAINLTGEAWRTVSLPLTAFADQPLVLAGVDQINFGINRLGDDQTAAVLWLDDLVISDQPLGAPMEEFVPYPPADIAITQEADFFALLDLTRPELAAVAEAVGRTDWPAAKTAWASHYRERTAPTWLWSHRQRQQLTTLIDEQFGGLARYVPRAETVLARDFNWLGVRKQLERDVQWLQGPVEWTHVLSRHAYLKDLGYAWWATDDPRFATDFADLLDDWITDNPVPRLVTNSRGPNGTVWRTLETGIRGYTWFDLIELFQGSEALDPELFYRLTCSLVEHARHLHRYTTQYRAGNWQVVEATGLACIGIMLPELDESAAWRERAFRYLALHMERDVYPDGAHSELTPGYHSWVMELFLQVALLSERNGYQVAGLMDRHARMYEFLQRIVRPDRRFPSLGDAGGPAGGSLANQLGQGALLHRRPDFRYFGPPSPVMGWLWLFGPDAVAGYAAMPASPPEFTSTMMPQAQYGVFRTGWEPDARYLLFDAAPWGGGHSHHDRLQVILHADRYLLIDPGMYSYDQPLASSYFRTAAAHNVVVFDEAWQPTSEPRLLTWSVRDGAGLAAASIADHRVTHQRTVLWLQPDAWLVVDHLTPGSETRPAAATRLFHLPTVEVVAGENQIATAYPTGTNLWIGNADDWRLEVRRGWRPTGGATAEEGPVAAWVLEGPLPAVGVTLLAPQAEGATPPQLTRLADAAGAVRVQVDWPDGRRDLAVVRPDLGTLPLAEVQPEGRAAVVRSRANQVVGQIIFTRDELPD